MDNTQEEDALIKVIMNNEPVEGVLLGLALEIIDKGGRGDSDKDLVDKMKEKIKSGKELTEYEKHIFVDVMMLHRKLYDLSQEDNSADITPRHDN